MDEIKPPSAGRWWVSWYEPAPEGDSRPRNWPLSKAIVGYWETGATVMVNPKDVEHTLCAVVDAADEAAVWAAIRVQGWTPSRERFIEQRDARWMPPVDRFPRKPRGSKR